MTKVHWTGLIFIGVLAGCTGTVVQGGGTGGAPSGSGGAGGGIVGSGGTSGNTTGGGGTSGNTTGGGGTCGNTTGSPEIGDCTSELRMPMNHRPAEVTCPPTQCDHDGCADQCMQDSDCCGGEVCLCNDQSSQVGGGNVCVPSNCRTDADCGPLSFCSPVLDPLHGTRGFYCHTCADFCIDNIDCGKPVVSSYCDYDPDGDSFIPFGHWYCATAK